MPRRLMRVYQNYHRIEVYSLAGQLVASVTGDNGMDISALTAGTYIVRIYTSQGVQAQKLLKR